MHEFPFASIMHLFHLFSIIMNFCVATQLRRIASRYIQTHIPAGEKDLEKGERKKKIRRKQSISYVRSRSRSGVKEMRSHRESISLIKGETGTGTPVAKQIRAHAFKGEGNSCLFPADGGRLTTFHLRYRAAYSPISSPPAASPFSLSVPLIPRPLARALIIPSPPPLPPSLAVCGRRAAF